MGINSQKISIKETEALIQAVGVSKVMALCSVTAPAISQWKITGMPEYRAKYLRLWLEKRNETRAIKQAQ